MYKKIFVILILSLFVGTSIIPVFGGSINKEHDYINIDIKSSLKRFFGTDIAGAGVFNQYLLELSPVRLHRIFRYSQFYVWDRIGQIQEKRPVFICLDKSKGLFGDDVVTIRASLTVAVFIKTYFFIVSPEIVRIEMVSVSLAQIAEEVFESLFVGVAG